MRIIPPLMVIMLAISVYSCGGDGGGSAEAPIQEEGDTDVSPARLVYDRELSTAERQALDSSTALMGSLDIDGRLIRGFSQVFGGSRSSNVVGYFEQRVNYALSGSTNIDSRIVSDPAEPVPTSVFDQELLARNLGAGLWLGSAVEGSGTVDFVINDKVVSINSSRVGIMQFGSGFVQSSPIEQVNTLVHEARHSDCTGGLRAEDLAILRGGELPVMNCGHPHPICPPDHPFGGLRACDSLPWGAYAVGAIHSLAVSQSCGNCSETEKTIAELEANDSLSRLLYNPEDLFEGRFGRANMTSSNKVEDEANNNE